MVRGQTYTLNVNLVGHPVYFTENAADFGGGSLQ